MREMYKNKFILGKGERMVCKTYHMQINPVVIDTEIQFYGEPNHIRPNSIT